VSELLGLVPFAYSWELDKPSPSGSAFPSPPFVGFNPLATSQPSGRPSPSLSALFILVPCVCSSAFVKPSPSQSAPPSEGFRGSEPSPETAETADRARNKDISTLIIFVFMFFTFLLFWLFLHREPAVLSIQIESARCGQVNLGCARCYALVRYNFQEKCKRRVLRWLAGKRKPSVGFLSESLTLLLVQILRIHRFSRVVHREPNVPSNR
jgi:hypothetical protein